MLPHCACGKDDPAEGRVRWEGCVPRRQVRSALDSQRPFFATPWNSPGQNTGVGSLSLLQGIFPTQGSNLGLLRCRQILHQLSHREAQEHCSGYPIPSPADLPDPGIEPRSPALQADSSPTDPSGKPRTETTETTYPTSLLENQRRKADSLLLVRDLDSLICVSLHRNHRSNFHSGIWRHPRHTCEERAQL